MLLPNLAPQQFPQTNANVDFPRGIRLSVVLAPGVEFAVTMGPDMIEQLYGAWEQAKQSQAKEMQIIARVKESKNGHG